MTNPKTKRLSLVHYGKNAQPQSIGERIHRQSPRDSYLAFDPLMLGCNPDDKRDRMESFPRFKLSPQLVETFLRK